MGVLGKLQLLADQAAVVVVSGVGGNRQHGLARVLELQLGGLERFLGDLCDLVDALGVIRIGELNVECIELIIVHGSREPVLADQARRFVVAHAVDIVADLADFLEQGAVLGEFLEVGRAVGQLACLALAVLEALDDGLELSVLALDVDLLDGLVEIDLVELDVGRQMAGDERVAVICLARRIRFVLDGEDVARYGLNLILSKYLIVRLRITLDKDAGLLRCEAQRILVRFFAGLLEPCLGGVVRQIAARHLDRLDMGIAVPLGIGRGCRDEHGHHGQHTDFLEHQNRLISHISRVSVSFFYCIANEKTRKNFVMI